jgi:hypothetical protein
MFESPAVSRARHHSKAMPVILTEPEEVETWMTAPLEQAKALQRPCRMGLVEVARGVRGRGRDRPQLMRNSDHGLPRSNEDKRRAVATLFNDPEWSRWSSRKIAKQCAVSPDLVDGNEPHCLFQAVSEPTPPATAPSRRCAPPRSGSQRRRRATDE